MIQILKNFINYFLIWTHPLCEEGTLINTKRSDTFVFCNSKLIKFQHDVDLDEPIKQNPLKAVVHAYRSHRTKTIYPFKVRKAEKRSAFPGRGQKQHRIETTADEEVAMVFSSSNLILCPPFSTETQVKKIPHSHKIQQQQLPVKK